MPVASEMARRGHEVVVITQHPDKKPDHNLTEITIDGKIFNDMIEKVSVEKLKMNERYRTNLEIINDLKF